MNQSGRFDGRFFVRFFIGIYDVLTKFWIITKVILKSKGASCIMYAVEVLH